MCEMNDRLSFSAYIFEDTFKSLRLDRHPFRRTLLTAFREDSFDDASVKGRVAC